MRHTFSMWHFLEKFASTSCKRHQFKNLTLTFPLWPIVAKLDDGVYIGHSSACAQRTLLILGELHCDSDCSPEHQTGCCWIQSDTSSHYNVSWLKIHVLRSMHHNMTAWDSVVLRRLLLDKKWTGGQVTTKGVKGKLLKSCISFMVNISLKQDVHRALSERTHLQRNNGEERSEVCINHL